MADANTIQVPEFSNAADSKTSVEIFIRSVDNGAKVNNLSSEKAAELAQARFTGDVVTWYARRSDEHSINPIANHKHWTHAAGGLRAALLEKYGAKTSWIARMTTMCNLKQNPKDKASDFQVRCEDAVALLLETTVGRAQMGEANIMLINNRLVLGFFMNGLRPTEKLFVHNAKPDTVAKALEAAETCEENEILRGRSQAQAAAISSKNHEGSKQTSDIAAYSASSSRVDKSHLKCDYCGRTRHVKDDCWARRDDLAAGHDYDRSPLYPMKNKNTKRKEKKKEKLAALTAAAAQAASPQQGQQGQTYDPNKMSAISASQQGAAPWLPHMSAMFSAPPPANPASYLNQGNM